MAEKRAKDRVILKLVGLHGYVTQMMSWKIQQDNPIDKPKDPATQAADPAANEEKAAARTPAKRAPAKAPAKQSLSPSARY